MYTSIHYLKHLSLGYYKPGFLLALAVYSCRSLVSCSVFLFFVGEVVVK